MRKLVILLLLLVSCEHIPGERELPERVILQKAYFNTNGDLMPTGLCRFQYKNATLMEFQDSCHFYFVGDTIKSSRR
jgi:hypothetical protein